MHNGIKHDAKTRFIDDFSYGWTDKFTIAPRCKATVWPTGVGRLSTANVI